MYDYARSDTHFLLYIFDNIRNELLAKSSAPDSGRDLVNDVRDSSKREAMQRYERYLYDAKTGSGVWGWNNMLSRSADRFDRQQFAVLRAVHEWRDKVAREEDESVHQILTNKAVLLIAKEMPTEMPPLLSCFQHSHISTKKRAQELLELVKRAKAEGVNGPELQDLVLPRGHSKASNFNSSASFATTLSTELIPTPTRTPERPQATSCTTLATLNVSQFWGATINRDAQDLQGVPSNRTNNELHLALPLPPLTRQIFETKTADDPLTPVRTSADPGSRVEHQYTRKRKSQEEDVFVLKKTGGSKKRKITDVQERPEPVARGRRVVPENGFADGEAAQSEIPLVDGEDQDGSQSRSQRKRERKRRKLQEALQRTSGDGDGEAEKRELEAFDYEKAPSVLDARKENTGASGVKRGIDPYTKSLDAPKGMRKVQREVPGRSMTYRS